MGIPKHGKNSATSKNSARYKSEGRQTENKARHIAQEARKQTRQKCVKG